jgi:acetyl-CoA acetyltransferase
MQTGKQQTQNKKRPSQEEDADMLTQAYVPYGGYYSSPFARWQASLANANAITLGAETAKRWMETKAWDPKLLDYLILGITIGQPKVFYGGPWASALAGAPNIPGVIVSQACSTSTTGFFQAAAGIETGMYSAAYCLMVDRCSNGPHTIWPNPQGPGGQVISEDWVMEHFNLDPWAGGAMIQTAENVARKAGIRREECDAVTLPMQMALDKAGLGIGQIKAIKTHNPFAVNDIYMARQLGIDVMSVNNYGSSLIFGHPQAPTAGRLIIEGIEETAMAGGGYCLFGGCAAGDTAAALVLKIG